MAQRVSIRDFLHDVLANRARAKLTIEEFDALLNKADQIEKFSEKGLFIVTLTQQLHKMSNVNYSSIKKFINEFLTGLKPEKVKRQRQQASRRKPRRRPADSTHVTRDINGMAEESVSHPSNIEMVRLGAQGQSQQSDSMKVSENASKRSDPNKKDFEFAEQLNKISEGIEFMTGQQIENFQEQEFEEVSKASSSSTSQSFGVVSNLSQKMDLLKRREDREQKKTKTANRTAVRTDATVTKRKAGKKIMLDQNLTLEKTKATLNDTTYEQRSFSYQYSPWVDQYHAQNELFDTTNQEFQEAIKEKPLSMFSNIMLSARKQGRRDMHEDIPADLTQFDTGYHETMHDFTSQPMPQFSDQLQSGQFQMNELSIFKYDQANPTLGDISMKVNRPEPIVFYEMLAKMQKGEIVITQEDVKNFGQIRVELVSQ